MPKIKTQHKGSMLHFVAFILAVFCLAIINSSSASAAVSIATGVFTDDATDIRWEWVLDQNSEREEQQKLIIKFYDKPADLATVTVPSLSTVISKVPGADSTLNTYYLSSANILAQNENYPDLTRREATANTTKLDMSNTSKIQVLGVKPIINPEVETELVFGQNMVIGDGDDGKVITASICGRMYYNIRNNTYSCYDTYSSTYPVPNESTMTPTELNAYVPTYADADCIDFRNVTQLTYDSSKQYCKSVTLTDTKVGAFFGYKLKLTNFTVSNFNYVGWNAFANTSINGQTVTISGNVFLGGDIFKNSNIKKAIIETDSIGAGIFRDCAQLNEVVYSDNVTRITDDAFAGTNLTSFDFSTTNIKTIGPRAFEGAKLTSIKLDGVNRIEYRAFAENDLRELTLPKSINYLQSSLFANNSNLKKLTIAYDTLTSGTTLPMFVVLDNEWGVSASSGKTSGVLEEVNIIAPYAADEEVSSTHIPYEDYKWNYDAYTQQYKPECPQNSNAATCNNNSAAGNDYSHAQYGSWESNYYSPYWTDEQRAQYRGSGSDYEKIYAHVDTYKNVIAPIYFHNLVNLHKITIGEGYEFIGAMAFYDCTGFTYMGATTMKLALNETNHELNMPESLKGIGNGAFFQKFQEQIDFTIPRNIEFIGVNAFMNTFGYDKDVDFPNLVALGDHAFEKTRTKNIHLYDKIQYMGAQVFSDCIFLNDITFDLDTFNPDIYVAWAQPHRHGPEWYDGQFHITTEFGPRYPYSVSDSTAEQYGIRQNRDQVNNYWPMKFGTITFTEKNVSPLPGGFNNCYYGRNQWGNTNNNGIDNAPVGTAGCPGGSYGTGIYNTFFGHINADKVDIGDTAWKVLSPRMFVQSYIDEVILPKNLEVISGDSFSDAYMTEELIIPDTVKVIGDAAFDYGQTYYKTVWNPETWTYEKDWDYYRSHMIKITKLPSSLEYIGNDAFWADINLTADLNSPNLRHIGYKVFWGTNLRDVYLPPTVKSLHAGAFAGIETLRDIKIDFDFGALPPNYDDGFNPEDMPQAARDFAGANIYTYITQSCSAGGMISGYPVTNFYSLFSQRIVSDTLDDNGNITSYGQKESKTHFRKVTFTENAQTDIYMVNDRGYFSGFEFDELDLKDTGWKKLTAAPSAFKWAKIGKLTLPAGLEEINETAFEDAEIGDTLVIPSTVKTIGRNAFYNAKINGDLRIDGAETIVSPAFQKVEVSGKVTLPGSLKTIDMNVFQWAKMGSIEFSEGLETINSNGFYQAEIGGEFALPTSLKTVGWAGFMESKIHITNALPKNIEVLGGAAFYNTDYADNLVVPGSIQSIGWSALSTKDVDVHFDTITVEPDLTAAKTNDQMIHQMFWQVDVDKMIIKSNTLTGYEKPDFTEYEDFDGITRRAYYEEFWNMPFDEIEITNLPTITYAAFNNCSNLKKVDLSKDTALRVIRDRAFENDEKLDTILFAPGIKEETVAVGNRAFRNTGFQSVGKAGADFNLYAAHFDAETEVFSDMKKLKRVDVPETFSNGTIPSYTFYNDKELEEASVAYKVKMIDNAAFANDDKLARIFIWGNTTVKDENLPGYTAPETPGMGAVEEDEPKENVGPTIPEKTDIYAYSSWNAEPYAGSTARDSFEGEFYPLDEVLYITTNKTHVKVNDEETDFDKTGMIVYGLRRDGVVLESDSWGDFNNNVYRRSEKDLSFSKMTPAIMEDPAFATVWDTPVPVDELSYENENFENIDFELVDDEDGIAGVKRVNIIYTDAYTGGEPDTDVLPITDGDPVYLPVTLDDITKAVAIFGLLAATGAITLIASRRAFRRR